MESSGSASIVLEAWVATRRASAGRGLTEEMGLEEKALRKTEMSSFEAEAERRVCDAHVVCREKGGDLDRLWRMSTQEVFLPHGWMCIAGTEWGSSGPKKRVETFLYQFT